LKTLKSRISTDDLKYDSLLYTELGIITGKAKSNLAALKEVEVKLLVLMLAFRE
jgi:hypothetical protein